MKAEKTRELIDKSIDMVFGWAKKSNKTLHDLCVSTDSELTELERLAEIGRATERLLDDEIEGYMVSGRIVEGKFIDTEAIESVEELLQWYNAI